MDNGTRQPVLFKNGDQTYVCVRQLKGSVAFVWQAYKAPLPSEADGHEQPYAFFAQAQDEFKEMVEDSLPQGCEWVALKFPQSKNGDAIKVEADTLSKLSGVSGEFGDIIARAVEMILNNSKDPSEPFIVVEWTGGSSLEGLPKASQDRPEVQDLLTAWYKLCALVKFTLEAMGSSPQIFLTDAIKKGSIAQKGKELLLFDFNVGPTEEDVRGKKSAVISKSLQILGNTAYYLLTGSSFSDETVSQKGKQLGYNSPVWRHLPWGFREMVFGLFYPVMSFTEDIRVASYASNLRNALPLGLDLSTPDSEFLSKAGKVGAPPAEKLTFFDLARLNDETLTAEQEEEYNETLYAELRKLDLGKPSVRERAWATLAAVLPGLDGKYDPVLRKAWLLLRALEEYDNRFSEEVTAVWDKLLEGKEAGMPDAFTEVRDKNPAIAALLLEREIEAGLDKGDPPEDLESKWNELEGKLVECAKLADLEEVKQGWRTLLGDTWFELLQDRIKEKRSANQLETEIEAALATEPFDFAKFMEKAKKHFQLGPLVRAIPGEDSGDIEAWKKAINAVFNADPASDALLPKACQRLQLVVVEWVNAFTCGFVPQEKTDWESLLGLQRQLKTALGKKEEDKPSRVTALYRGLEEAVSIRRSIANGEYVKAEMRVRYPDVLGKEPTDEAVSSAYKKWLQHLCTQNEAARGERSPVASEEALDKLRVDEKNNLNAAAVILRDAGNNAPLNKDLEDQLEALRVLKKALEAREENEFERAYQELQAAKKLWPGLGTVIDASEPWNFLVVRRYLEKKGADRAKLKDLEIEALRTMAGELFSADGSKIAAATNIAELRECLDAQAAPEGVLLKLRNYRDDLAKSYREQSGEPLPGPMVNALDSVSALRDGMTYIIFEQWENALTPLTQYFRGGYLYLLKDRTDITDEVDSAILRHLIPGLIASGKAEGAQQLWKDYSSLKSPEDPRVILTELKERSGALLKEVASAYKDRKGHWWRFRKTQYQTAELNALRFIEEKVGVPQTAPGTSETAGSTDVTAAEPAVSEDTGEKSNAGQAAPGTAETVESTDVTAAEPAALEDTGEKSNPYQIAKVIDAGKDPGVTQLLPSQYYDVLLKLDELVRKKKILVRLAPLALLALILLAWFLPPLITSLINKGQSDSELTPTVSPTSARSEQLEGTLRISPPEVRAGGAQLWYTVAITNTGEQTTTCRLEPEPSDDTLFWISPDAATALPVTLSPRAGQTWILLRQREDPASGASPLVLQLKAETDQVLDEAQLPSLPALSLTLKMDPGNWVAGRDTRATGIFTPTATGVYIVTCKPPDDEAAPESNCMYADAGKETPFTCDLGVLGEKGVGEWHVNVTRLFEEQVKWCFEFPGQTGATSPYSTTFKVLRPRHAVVSPQPLLQFETAGISVGALHTLTNTGEIDTAFTVKWISATNITDIHLGIQLVKSGGLTDTAQLTHTVVLGPEARGPLPLLPPDAVLGPCAEGQSSCPLLRLAFFVKNDEKVEEGVPAAVALEFCPAGVEDECQKITLTWTKFSDAPVPEWLYIYDYEP